MNNYVLRKGSQDGKESVNAQLKEWEDSIAQKDTPTLHRLGMVKGVIATCGSFNIHCVGDLQTASETSAMKSSLKKTVKYLETSNDVLVSLTCSRLLGELFLSSTSSSRFSSQLPPSYSYIGDKSKLASFYDLLNASQQEEDCVTHAQTILEVFVATECPKLPPVSWTSPLNKLYQNQAVSLDSPQGDLKLACVTFALAFSDSCVDMLLWVSSLLQNSIFSQMRPDLQRCILESTPRILHALPNSKQKTLLEDLPIIAISTATAADDRNTMVECVLKTWLSVAEMEVPVQSTFTYLVDGVKKLRNVDGIHEVSAFLFLLNSTLAGFRQILGNHGKIFVVFLIQGSSFSYSHDFDQYLLFNIDFAKTILANL